MFTRRRRNYTSTVCPCRLMSRCGEKVPFVSRSANNILRKMAVLFKITICRANLSFVICQSHNHEHDHERGQPFEYYYLHCCQGMNKRVHKSDDRNRDILFKYFIDRNQLYTVKSLRNNLVYDLCMLFSYAKHYYCPSHLSVN